MSKVGGIGFNLNSGPYIPSGELMLCLVRVAFFGLRERRRGYVGFRACGTCFWACSTRGSQMSRLLLE